MLSALFIPKFHFIIIEIIVFPNSVVSLTFFYGFHFFFYMYRQCFNGYNKLNYSKIISN